MTIFSDLLSDKKIANSHCLKKKQNLALSNFQISALQSCTKICKLNKI